MIEPGELSSKPPKEPLFTVDSYRPGGSLNDPQWIVDVLSGNGKTLLLMRQKGTKIDFPTFVRDCADFQEANRVIAGKLGARKFQLKRKTYKQAEFETTTRAILVALYEGKAGLEVDRLLRVETALTREFKKSEEKKRLAMEHAFLEQQRARDRLYELDVQAGIF